MNTSQEDGIKFCLSNKRLPDKETALNTGIKYSMIHPMIMMEFNRGLDAFICLNDYQIL